MMQYSCKVISREGGLGKKLCFQFNILYDNDISITDQGNFSGWFFYESNEAKIGWKTDEFYVYIFSGW